MKPHRLCDTIKAARKAAGLTQVQLARKARLNYADIANYETRIIPTILKLERIAKVLKVRLEDLLNGTPRR